MSRKSILMSPADSNLYKYFERQFNVISSEYLVDLISYERYHADMQALKIQDKLFVNSNCKKLIEIFEKMNISFTVCDNIGVKYPENVALNAALIGDKLICNEKALHMKVKEYCKELNIQLINVKQGYAKCSTLVLDEESIITDDDSIANAALTNGINVLKVEKGDIFLDEKTVGFIGGASARIGDTVYFFGNISTHRNSSEIVQFIENSGLKMLCVRDSDLIDIGGIEELY